MPDGPTMINPMRGGTLPTLFLMISKFIQLRFVKHTADIFLISIFSNS